MRLSLQAELQGLEVSAWWQANRPKAPALFDEEIARALAYLQEAALSGAPLHRQDRRLRKVLLHKTRYALIYHVDEERREVEVLTLWHTSKGSGPPL